MLLQQVLLLLLELLHLILHYKHLVLFLGKLLLIVVLYLIICFLEAGRGVHATIGLLDCQRSIILVHYLISVIANNILILSRHLDICWRNLLLLKRSCRLSFNMGTVFIIHW